jgi:hypothetical protein
MVTDNRRCRLRSPFLWNLVAFMRFMCLSLTDKAHTWTRPVHCGRKSGYAPVEMTILLGNEDESSQTNLSSRPERSVVERSAVPLSGFYADSGGPGTASVKAHDRLKGALQCSAWWRTWFCSLMASNSASLRVITSCSSDWPVRRDHAAETDFISFGPTAPLLS